MTWYALPKRQRWRRDYDGVPSTAKHSDSIVSETFDLSRHQAILEDGATISSVTWTTNGVTLTNKSNTTTTFSADVDGVGEATAVVVFSDGQEYKQTYRWNTIDTQESNDYGS